MLQTDPYKHDLRGLPAEKITFHYEDQVSRIYLRNDHLIEVHLLATFYNAERVIGVINKIQELSAEPHLLVLVITEPHSMVTYSGMQAVFSKLSVNYSVAKAYVFQAKKQFFLAKLGMTLFKPKTPIRFFRNRRDAEIWLSSFQGYGI